MHVDHAQGMPGAPCIQNGVTDLGPLASKTSWFRAQVPFRKDGRAEFDARTIFGYKTQSDGLAA
jgi:hypothetical protein